MDESPEVSGFTIRNLWRLGVAIFILTSIYISTILGQSITVSFVTFTLYGSVLLIRKMLQLWFAILNNRKMMSIVRTPIFEAIEALDLDQEVIERTISLASKNMPFDDMRSIIMRELNLSDTEWKDLVLSTFSQEDWLTCDLSVPIYGVTPQEIIDQVESFVGMTYEFRTVYMVLNGTVNVGPVEVATSAWRRIFQLFGREQKKKKNGIRVRDEKAWTTIVELCERYNADERVKAHFVPVYLEEGDKRGAMYHAFVESIRETSDLTANIDGDTIVDRDALANTVRVFNYNPDWACLTGDVRLLNPLYNLLTILTMIRYFNAFNIERAAQSLFEQMTVPSGPYFVYKTSKLAKIVDKWRYQQFRPKHPDDYCSFGDDRHTGTLGLINDWSLGFLPESIVWTEAPTKVNRWMLQQLRWARSAWRETFILFDYGVKNGFGFLHWFVFIDQLYLTFFPFLVLGVIIAVTTRTITTTITSGYTEGAMVALPYVITILIVNWVFNSTYGMNLKGSWWFLLSPLYVFYWLFILTPVKFWAAFTVNENGWSARTAEGVLEK